MSNIISLLSRQRDETKKKRMSGKYSHQKLFCFLFCVNNKKEGKQEKIEQHFVDVLETAEIASQHALNNQLLIEFQHVLKTNEACFRGLFQP